MKSGLSSAILAEITEGRSILFLGAGSSYGCKDPSGSKRALLGKELGEELSKRFLGGARMDQALAKIASLSVGEAGLLAVQHFVCSIYNDIVPFDYHSIITKFRWKAIITTNYDQVIEKAYAANRERLQNPIPVIRNGDLSRAIDDPRAVPIIKLHGCVSQSGDTALPLILSKEQYLQYQKGRERLAISLSDWARDRSIIFCGYEISDPHVENVVFALTEGTIDRPRFASINPIHDDMDQRYWSAYRVDTIKSTFEKFLKSLDQEINTTTRNIGSLFTGNHGTLSRWVQVGRRLSNDLQAALHRRLLHVSHQLPLEAAEPSKFFKGDSTSWAPLSEGMDFSRNISTSIQAECITEVGAGTRLLLLKGHAGSGKSIALKRICWNLSDDLAKRLCFFISDSIENLKEAIDELCEVCGERVFIFVDNVLFDADSLSNALVWWRKRGTNVTVVGAARLNEWNMHCGDIGVVPDSEYTLGDLSAPEIHELCNKLEKFGCLGELARLDTHDRTKRFMDVHDRQLLVALHEVTSGRPFRDIIRDEYFNIVPEEARILYLDICSLNRFKTSVRAGLISRVTGIRFVEFRSKFLSPLERVVSVSTDARTGDYVYHSRHPDIAAIVFDEVLRNPTDKANQLIRIVSGLNAEYSTDNVAASQMIKGRAIADNFADRRLADRIFDAAEHAGLDQAFVLQQRALFEINHPNGSTTSALRYIQNAIDCAGRRNPSLPHTKAVVLKSLARETASKEMRNRFREQSLELLRSHVGRKNAHCAVTQCEVLFDQLKDISSPKALDGPLTKEAYIRKLTDLERALSEGIQKYPSDSFLAGIRADLHSFLKESPEALVVLRTAFERNPGNEIVALRYAKQLQESGNLIDAMATLRRAVELNAGSKSLNFELAKELMKLGELVHSVAISRHLRRSFSDGDIHHEAQFWYARHEYLFGTRSKAQSMYSEFKNGKVPYLDRDRKKGIVRKEDGEVRLFRGTVRQVRGDFGFLRCADLGDDIHLNRSEYGDNWEVLRPGDLLEFAVGFTFVGPTAVDARQ